MSEKRNATPILCPHGVATSWQGVARFGDRLPECEHCEECNPGAKQLAPPVAEAPPGAPSMFYTGRVEA